MKKPDTSVNNLFLYISHPFACLEQLTDIKPDISWLRIWIFAILILPFIIFILIIIMFLPIQQRQWQTAVKSQQDSMQRVQANIFQGTE